MDYKTRSKCQQTRQNVFESLLYYNLKILKEMLHTYIYTGYIPTQ